jgi:class 3 adenylate cyclase
MASDQVKRKLAAILAADIAGYSRLMGADEAGTLTRLKEYRRELIDPKNKQYRGRVVKTTGDGILIEFPSVVDAVSYSIELQQGMCERNADVPLEKRIEFRIGINLGDVIIEGRDLYGDGVNIAARLEGLAEPGGIAYRKLSSITRAARLPSRSRIWASKPSRTSSNPYTSIVYCSIPAGTGRYLGFRNRRWLCRTNRPSPCCRSRT